MACTLRFQRRQSAESDFAGPTTAISGHSATSTRATSLRQQDDHEQKSKTESLTHVQGQGGGGRYRTIVARVALRQPRRREQGIAAHAAAVDGKPMRKATVTSWQSTQPHTGRAFAYGGGAGRAPASTGLSRSVSARSTTPPAGPRCRVRPARPVPSDVAGPRHGVGQARQLLANHADDLEGVDRYRLRLQQQVLG